MMWRAFVLLLIANCFSFRHVAAKAKETLRINSLRLPYKSPSNKYRWSAALTNKDILLALQATHTTADEYYTIRHAMAWNTDSVIPAKTIAANSDLFRKCNYDIQGCVEANRLSKERLISISRTKMKSWKI